MRSRRRIFATFVAGLLWTFADASACPLCGSPQKTISEDFAAADVVVLAQWSDGRSPAGMLVGKTTFSVVEVARGESASLKKDAKLEVPRFHAGQRGDLFVLFGKKTDDELDWRPLEITEAGYQYLKQAPSREAPVAKRLEYYVQFLEFSDDRISMDAYWEFANAPWEDVVKIKHKLDRVKLRQWVNSDQTLPTRLNLYFLLLGLCGNDDDARMLEALVIAPPPGQVLGRDGLMSSYLLLTGDKGLKVIDDKTLTNPRAGSGEVLAAMQALRFLWSYGNDRIAPDRLRQSLRLLLSDSSVADLVIADLARWEDWTIQDQVVQQFDNADSRTRKTIVRYVLLAAKLNLKPADLPDSAKQARQHLEKLRAKNRKLVQDTERSFIP
jgi:hypothetical protein